MLERVVEQVEHQTMQQHAVTVQAKSVGGGRFAELQRHAARFSQRSHAAGRCRYQFGDRHFAMIADRTAGIDARQEEQIVDDA